MSAIRSLEFSLTQQKRLCLQAWIGLWGLIRLFEKINL
jgi:hypothetical protein